MSKAVEATNDFCTRCFKYNRCTKVQSECVIADSYKEGFEDGYKQAEKDCLENKHEKSWRLDEKLWKGIKDIEEASYQYTYDASNDWAYDIPTWEDVQDAFKAGSEWQKEQMMAKAIEAVVSQVPCSNEIILYNPSSVDKYYLPQEMNKLGLNKGDKIKLVIIKED